MVDTVSETIRESWGVVFDMNVVEFINIVCYSKDKLEYKNRKIKEWAKKN